MSRHFIRWAAPVRGWVLQIKIPCHSSLSLSLLATHGLSWCLRGLGLGGFHPGTWIVREDLSLVQFELYQGTGWNPPSPWILKHQLSPCVENIWRETLFLCLVQIESEANRLISICTKPRKRVSPNSFPGDNLRRSLSARARSGSEKGLVQNQF